MGPLILGLAVPLIKNIASMFMDQGLNLAANAITGGGKKAKEFIEEKTGVSLNDPDKLTANDVAKIRRIENDPEISIELKQLSLEYLKEDNRHEEAIENNWSEIVTTLSNADSNSSSTRPKIAVGMAQVVAFAIIIFVSALAYAVCNNAIDTIKSISQAWPLLLAILATPTALLRSYFGMRTKEKQARYNMASSIPQKDLVGDIIGMFKK